MIDKSSPERRLTPGDVLAIETETGTRHVQVTHLRAPYPDVVRAIHPAMDAGTPEQVAKGATAFIAMVELSRALRDDNAIRVVGHATIPQQDRDYPKFRLPIRNHTGEIVYWWMWDGEGLSVAPDADDLNLPIREVMPVDALCQRLGKLT